MHNLVINFKPSKVAASILMTIAGLSLMSIWLSMINVLWQLLASFVLISYVGYIYCIYLRLGHPRSIIALYKRDSLWLAKTSQGEVCPVNLQGMSTVTRYGAILLFKGIDHTSYPSCLIASDSMDRESYRRLTCALISAKQSQM